METKLFVGSQPVPTYMDPQFNESSLEDFLEQCVERAFQWDPQEQAQVPPGTFQMYPVEQPGTVPVLPFEGTPIKPEVKIQVLDLKESYEKGQSRRKANSQQRLLDGEVNFIVNTSHALQAACVYVERIPEAARILQDTTGRVPLNIIWKKSDGNQVNFSVDLDSVYETTAGSKVYELSRVKGEERNIFQLVLNIMFLNGVSKEFTTKRFRVKSKVNPQIKSESRDDLDESSSTEDHLSFSFTDHSPHNNRKRKREALGDCSPGSVSSGFGSDVSSFLEVVTEHLEAKTATIEELRLTKPILTQRGDIAYHIPLDKSLLADHEEFEEGDVIGCFDDPDGKTCIQKLSHLNAHKFKLSGVISRSAYLEAKVNIEDDEKDKDEVVCMIGMVKVKVMGPVKNGERIYASLESPGVAVPQSRVPDATSHDAILLGQSLETVDCESNDISCPQCFVSLILTIGTNHVTQAMKDLRSGVHEDVKTEIKQVKKKCLKGIRYWSIPVLIFLVLLGVLFYQLYTPGTALRYFMCSRGSIDDSDLYFTFITMDLQTPRVHGIEFTFKKLKNKLDLKFDQMKSKGTKYYLNIDRCAHGGIRTVPSRLEGLQMVRGAEVFGVNSNCTTVYYYSDGWDPYTSGRYIVCT